MLTNTTTSTSLSIENANNSQVNNLADFSCNICFEILVEPIKLTCNHELCLACFRSMIVNKNFLCPMCRKKIPQVYRKKRESNLRLFVDDSRWNTIKQAFPNEVEKRVNEDRLKKEEEKRNNRLIRRIIKRDEGYNSINQYVNALDRLARTERREARVTRRMQRTRLYRFIAFIKIVWDVVCQALKQAFLLFKELIGEETWLTIKIMFCIFGFIAFLIFLEIANYHYRRIFGKNSNRVPAIDEYEMYQGED